ncbi:tumor necrosis factor receptor superfamily member 26-like [Hipposideros larvatus]
MSVWLPLLLLVPASVTTATSVTRCGSDKYELKSLGLCCPLCPAGQYVTKHCDGTQSTQCSQCEPGTFTAHPNSETSCLPCAQCRDDQEEVTLCTPTRDRQCQCKTGSYYCDSGDCVEMCYRCTSLRPEVRNQGVAAASLPRRPWEDPASSSSSGWWRLFLAPHGL